MVTTLILVGDLLLIVGLAIRVLMRGLPVAVAQAWLVVIIFVPYVGPILYLLIGENQLGRKRAQRAEETTKPILEWITDLKKRHPVDCPEVEVISVPIQRLAGVIKKAPAVSGNQLELMQDSECILRSIIQEIDQSKTTCHLMFYIWNDGGLADEVAEALMHAAQRGVICRVLVDFVGSRPFLKGKMIKRMRKAGIYVKAALEVNLLRMWVQRLDLRNHRKIVVIDGQVGYTGSQNMADPKFFKKTANVGQWVDTMVRMEGPAVEVLNILFLRDWELETGFGLEEFKKTGNVHKLPRAGNSNVQVVPSSPGIAISAIHEILLRAIYTAKKELIITTPYFVPTETMVFALCSAALSGVEVTLVVPEKNDSLMARYASESTFETLSWAGVRIARFRGGLLHSKTISIDGLIGVIGSVNMDRRSFYINFEISVFVYDPEFTTKLRDLQLSYVDHSDLIEADKWKHRPTSQKILEKVFRLVSPLL